MHSSRIFDGIKGGLEAKAKELQEAGYPILRGPRLTGDGYYEFEALDPEWNRLEVMSNK